LTVLTKQVLETALDVELADHLGHDRGERSGSGNVRNGSSAKTVRTDVGEVRIAAPRDRADPWFARAEDNAGAARRPYAREASSARRGFWDWSW
jgi:transposase-like protein